MSTIPVAPGLPGFARRRARRIAKSDKVAVACLVVIGIALLAAIFGPLLAPHDPNASNLNLANADTRPNLVVAKVGTGRRICLFTSSATHLLVDFEGWFSA